MARAAAVNRSTAHRWVKAGLIPAPSGRKRGPASSGQRGGGHVPAVPEGWAAAVRARYDLDATEEARVELAEGALGLARDVSLRPADRLAAMGRFARLVQQIDLEVPDGQTQINATTTAARRWPRRA
jgi:hypothetical protein